MYVSFLYVDYKGASCTFYMCNMCLSGCFIFNTRLCVCLMYALHGADKASGFHVCPVCLKMHYLYRQRLIFFSTTELGFLGRPLLSFLGESLS